MEKRCKNCGYKIEEDEDFEIIIEDGPRKHIIPNTAKLFVFDSFIAKDIFKNSTIPIAIGEPCNEAFSFPLMERNVKLFYEPKESDPQVLVDYVKKVFKCEEVERLFGDRVIFRYIG